MQAIADELHESWINGNLTEVINNVVMQATGAKSALLGALLCNAMSPKDRMVFLRMLNDKVNE